MSVGLAVPMVLYGWQGNLDLLVAWSRTVFDSTAPNLLDTDNISLAAMWAKWLGVGPIATALAITTSAALVGLFLAMLQRRRRLATADYVDLAFLMLVVPLLSPQGVGLRAAPWHAGGRLPRRSLARARAELADLGRGLRRGAAVVHDV